MTTDDIAALKKAKKSSMSRLLVDDVKDRQRALLNRKINTNQTILAPSNGTIYASGANELTVVEGCVIVAVGGAGIFSRQQYNSYGC